MTYRGEEWIKSGRRTRADSILPKPEMYDILTRAKRLYGKPPRRRDFVELMLIHPLVRASPKAGNRDWCSKYVHNWEGNFFHDDEVAQMFELRAVYSIKQPGNYDVLELYDDLNDEQLDKVDREAQRIIDNAVERLKLFRAARPLKPLIDRCTPAGSSKPRPKKGKRK